MWFALKPMLELILGFCAQLIRLSRNGQDGLKLFNVEHITQVTD